MEFSEQPTQPEEPQTGLLEEFRAANMNIVRHLITPDGVRESWQPLEDLVEAADAIGRRLIASRNHQPLDKSRSIGGMITRLAQFGA